MSKTVFGYQACRNPHSYSLYTVMCRYARLKNMDYLIILEIILVSGIIPLALLLFQKKIGRGRERLFGGGSLLKRGPLFVEIRHDKI